MLRIDLSDGKYVDLERDGVLIARLHALEILDRGRCAFLLATHFNPDGTVNDAGVRYAQAGEDLLMFDPVPGRPESHIIVALSERDHQIRLMFDAPDLKVYRPEYRAKLAQARPLPVPAPAPFSGAVGVA